MQYNQLLCANTLPNYGQHYNNCNPALQCNGCPEIIGEGNVVSMVFPDGTVQMLFTPNAQWAPNAFSPNLGNTNRNNPYWNNTGAWFVRGVPGLSPPAIFYPQYQSSRHYFSSDHKMPTPGFQLKFHNDSWTSTTDLHYFYPSLRKCDWFPKAQSLGCAAVQVKVPSVTNTVCHYEVLCSKPCHCNPDRCKAKTVKGTYNKLPKISQSNMSIEEYKPDKETNCSGTNTETKVHKCCWSNEITKSNNTSQCDELPQERIGLDKSVTTYTDQSSSCSADNGRETQTSENNSPISKTKSVIVQSNDVRTELWLPKTPISKKAMTKSSGAITATCESSCRSGNCSCSSDTDQYEDI